MSTDSFSKTADLTCVSSVGNHLKGSVCLIHWVAIVKPCSVQYKDQLNTGWCDWNKFVILTASTFLKLPHQQSCLLPYDVHSWLCCTIGLMITRGWGLNVRGNIDTPQSFACSLQNTKSGWFIVSSQVDCDQSGLRTFQALLPDTRHTSLL